MGMEMMAPAAASALASLLMMLMVGLWINPCTAGVGDRFQYVVLDDDPDKEPPVPTFTPKNYTV